MKTSFKRVWVNDTTLRDGEQAAGVAFSPQTKVRLALLLDQAGVDGIEAGIPAMGGSEAEAVAQIAALPLGAAVSAWCRAVEGDVLAAWRTGVRRVHITVPASRRQWGDKMGKDFRWALASCAETVGLAGSLGLAVTVGAEDASRAAERDLVELAAVAADAGAVRLRYADTVGILEPFTALRRLRRLVRESPIPLEIHTHNDFGLAVANALAGVRAGAAWVSATVAGLGERAGNASLEEVAMALRCLTGYEVGLDPGRLRGLAVAVAKAARRPLPGAKPVVGRLAFAHEAGIHVAGVLRETSTYEPFDPAQVGARRRLVLGKHSGTAALCAALGLSKDEAKRFLPFLRELAIARGGKVSRREAEQGWVRVQRGDCAGRGQSPDFPAPRPSP